MDTDQMKPRLPHSTQTPTGHTCTRAHTHTVTRKCISTRIAMLSLFIVSIPKSNNQNKCWWHNFCIVCKKKFILILHLCVCKNKGWCVVRQCCTWVHWSADGESWARLLPKYVMAQCDQRREAVKKRVGKNLHLQNRLTTKTMEKAYQRHRFKLVNKLVNPLMNFVCFITGSSIWGKPTFTERVHWVNLTYHSIVFKFFFFFWKSNW